ncbi:peptide-methionine (S)-S-oxide reductase [Gammaproteobacteria bacterium 42_54_T18]|nr:peptide-methionine (S)-S-oxide reductase [Gammaproteobacteria bacterium 42_54_T18]
MTWFSNDNKSTMISTQNALVGRPDRITTAEQHFVYGIDLKQPLKRNEKEVIVGLGCFWGAEKCFWKLDGVTCTAVGYGAGYTPNPTYEEVCSGKTGHNEVVRVAYDCSILSFEEILTVFWEAHNPTQGMQQGNDRGTQYRSGLYLSDSSEIMVAEESRDRYQEKLHKAGFSPITTEIALAGPFYYAEAYHQQYLAKKPQGYCGLGGTGVSCGEG